KDTLQVYIKAADALVGLVEQSDSLKAYSYLCMTYRELWPHTYQDGKDHRVIQEVLRRVQKINPKSASASVCLVVSQWVKGKYDDALRIMDAHLSLTPGLVFFNQMTGDIYASRKDYSSASYYFAKVRELWTPPPTWSKPILQEARMYRKRKIFGTAVKLYRKLLNENRKHAVAQIELGIVEFKAFQNIGRAQDHIRSGLAANQFIPKMIESEAYATLAKMYQLQGDQKEALKMAQKSVSVDSSNEEARSIVVNLGGIKALNEISIDNVNMVYLGEQYMKMGNFTAAQAEFRAAFEANNKNAFAALRAGQALWALNQSNEAISWVKKAVSADPRFVRSYIILSDYMSARYNYTGAIETLKSARNINRRHHGIYRGFALIELRRRNYDGAIRFAERALQLYDTDIATILIMAKAYYYAEDPESAFKYVHQAIELDPSSEDAHGTYARVLVALQGTLAGIDYLNDIIARFDKIGYVRTLGDILAEEERNKEAIQTYYEALAKNPKDKPTLLALGKILQKEKDYTCFFVNEEKSNYHGAGIVIKKHFNPTFNRISAGVCT
ncbi:MAG: tetratricopeptide repeat protein, partial [Bdellovibrionales bacterium]|nr:tetratricopeptide repeat protein [Bdellovibrionales bacterium]NQZ20302.1 tetratricopeptide repeat protein [Bdellovibrionales bacterium]